MNNGNAKKPEVRSFPGTMAAIAWSFIGLRRRKDFEQDIGRLNPFYVIIAALIGAALFIGLLFSVARSVAS